MVHVLDKKGKPLIPCRENRVRLLLGVSVFLCAGRRRLFHGAARGPMRRARACGAVVKSVLILPDHSRETIVK
jgi:hypothetical protein